MTRTAPPRLTGLLTGIAVTATLVALEQTAFVSVVPRIAADLPSARFDTLFFTGFLIGQVAGALLAGQLVHRGRPVTMYAGACVLVTIGLAVTAGAPTPVWLGAGRALQGLGAGGLITWVYSVLAQRIPESGRARALSVFSAAFVAPSIGGPALAEVLTAQFGWRALTVALIALALICLAAVARTSAPVPPGAPGATPRAPVGVSGDARWMPAAIVMALAGATALTSPDQTVAGTAAVLSAAALAVVLARLASMGTPVLLPAASAKGLLATAYFLAQVLVVAVVARTGAVAPALVVGAGAAAWTVGTLLLRRAGHHAAVGGTALLAGGLCVLTIWPGTAPVTWVLVSIGMGLANAATSAAAFGAIGHAARGTAPSILYVLELFGPAMSIAAAEQFGGGGQLGGGLPLAAGLGAGCLGVAVWLSHRQRRQRC